VPVIASGGVGNLDHLVAGVIEGPCQRGAGRLDLPFRRGDASPTPMPRWPPPDCRFARAETLKARNQKD
jgi:hypothetical protein